MFIFEPDISFLSHKYTTHVDFLEFQSDRFGVLRSDRIGDIISNDESLFFGSTGEGDKEGIGIAIDYLSVPFRSGMDQLLCLLISLPTLIVCGVTYFL